ncbi:hypothetical protein [Natrinema pallidum]|uniref:Pectin degradation protein n=2 Tax=Natrinema pallidum TaxID=69527 RepID=L9YQM2_9EURY|nr:hypothetical protein [Natrinema pallidum]ELY76414.1 pectin degradation protein [Natrinema pallidum DSM 3751]QCW03026.1 cupin domain-containing protein [Natrinema pallidum]
MNVTEWDDPDRIDALPGGERSPPLEAGDSYVVPPGTVHGVRALEPCRVVDAFAPPLGADTSE